MKTASKIQSLMIDLKNEEVKEVRNTIEIEIIRVADLIPKEVELIKTEQELRKLIYADGQGVWVDYDAIHRAKDNVDRLKKEIDVELL